MKTLPSPQDFDGPAFLAAIEERREREGLSWPALAKAVWDQSHILNAGRPKDHPIAVSTIRNIGARGGGTCQHALFLLRWLELPPEAFIAEPAPGTAGVPLPAADAAHRLRWRVRRMHAVLNGARIQHEATWEQLAARLDCTPNQLTGLARARFATGMRLAMRITQLLERPAAEFVAVTKW